MRRRLLAVAVVLVAVVGLRIGPRLLSLHTPGRLPAPDAVAAAEQDASLVVLTLNVLCSFCAKTGYDDWQDRLPELRGVLTRHQPHLAAIQELARPAEVRALIAGTGLAALHHPLWPDSVLLYRADRFAVRDAGQVWLSPTPTLPLARSWRPGLPRLAQWAILRDGESGGDLLLAATHLDGDATNKDAAAALLGATFPPLAADLPVILAGDLNTANSDDRIAVLRGGLRDAAEGAVFEQLGTLEGIPHTRRELRPSLRIDHVLLSAHFETTQLIHDATVYGDPPRRPSDHPAIVARTRLKVQTP